MNWSFGISHKLIGTGGLALPVQAAEVGKAEEKPWPCLAQGPLPPVKDNEKGSDSDGLSSQTIAQSGAESQQRCSEGMGTELQAAEVSA